MRKAPIYIKKTFKKKNTELVGSSNEGGEGGSSPPL